MPESDRPSIDSYFRSTYGRDALSAFARDNAKRLFTAVLLPFEGRRAARLVTGASPLRLHLGAADTYLEGWCNIDYARPGRRLDLYWDLRRSLPFPDGSVEHIFSEHLLEHISYPDAMDLLRDCHRLLRPGGICRIGVPDFERYIRSYVGSDPLLEQHRRHAPTRALAVAEIFFLHGHRSNYDFETLSAMAAAIGFAKVELSRAGEGRIQPSPDSLSRAVETLYVDALK